MVRKSTINQYFSAGKNLIPLDRIKFPRKNWNTTLYAEKEIYSHDGNIGWKLDSNDLVIDVDPRNGGFESFEKLKNDLNLELLPTVNTPSGGFHIYLKIPETYKDIKFRKTIREYKGIDFLTEGCYCLISGCKRSDGDYTWFDDIFGKFEQNPTPDAILNLITYDTSNYEDLGDFEGLVGGKSANWSEEKVLQMLEKLDPSMGNDEWVKVGMALHDWDPIDGLRLWEEWSLDGDNYEKGMTGKRWKSFDLNGGVTLGTVSHMVKEVDYDECNLKLNSYINKIKNSNEKKLEFELIPEIKKQNFSKINLEKLAKLIQDRYKALSEVKLPINDIRNLLHSDGVVNGHFVQDGEKPRWCEKWVYVNSHTAFANLESLKILKTEAFNIENGKYVPESVNGSKQSAAKYIADKGYIETVDSMAYLPNTNDPICIIGNNKVLNSFNYQSVPIAAESFTEEGKEAIEMVKKHIKFICSNDINSNIFTQWLAHQVQFPGKQVLWSPVIQSIQGVGKSFFGELLRMCLGDRNIGTVSPTQIVSDFNGWATNVMVNVLEELRVKGHNRYDAVNSLKPLITDRMIQINDKGVKQYMTYNTTNYICFTNYKDSLPLGEDDRRWWVIFVPLEKLEDMKDHVGESPVTYFPKLFNAVRNYGNEVRKWLLEYEISDEFLAIKQAPMTDSKLSMIATEEDSFEGYSELKELIEKGGKYYNKDVVSSSDLFNALLITHSDLDIQTSKRNILMKKLGYSLVSQQVKIDGKPKKIWTRRTLTNDEIRDSFK